MTFSNEVDVRKRRFHWNRITVLVCANRLTSRPVFYRIYLCFFFFFGQNTHEIFRVPRSTDIYRLLSTRSVWCWQKKKINKIPLEPSWLVQLKSVHKSLFFSRFIVRSLWTPPSYPRRTYVFGAVRTARFVSNVHHKRGALASFFFPITLDEETTKDFLHPSCCRIPREEQLRGFSSSSPQNCLKIHKNVLEYVVQILCF